MYRSCKRSHSDNQSHWIKVSSIQRIPEVIMLSLNINHFLNLDICPYRKLYF